MIDLHTHSTASDGSYSPADLVGLAARSGIRKLALTDHDTTDGINEARTASQNFEIELISGVELSAQWQNRTLHIVGLYVDPEDTALKAAIARAKNVRADRAREIGSRLEKAGITNAYRLTKRQHETEQLGRSHFARMLVEQGYAKNFTQVFKRYMVRGKPGYASARWMDLETAINTIHQAGGVAVFAHPARYNLSRTQLRKAIRDFSSWDGDALEIVSGKTNPKEIEDMTRLAQDNNLAGSMGSDFHGPDKPWISLGQLPPFPSQCTPIWQTSESP